MIKESASNGVVYSTDKARLDLLYIHGFLRTSYWAKEIPVSVVQASIENSLCIGIYGDSGQIGFARIITDYATFAYLADVFVDERFRGRGISKGLMQFVFSLEFLQGVRRFMLATWDAHGLYEQFGFKLLSRPDRYMEIKVDDMYSNKTEQE